MAESTIKPDAPVANNLTTTEAGYALDARQGKVLSEARHFIRRSISFSVPAANTWYQSGSVNVGYSGWTFQGITEFVPHQIKVCPSKMRVNGNTLEWAVCTADKSNVPAGTYWVSCIYTN